MEIGSKVEGFKMMTVKNDLTKTYLPAYKTLHPLREIN